MRPAGRREEGGTRHLHLDQKNNRGRKVEKKHMNRPKIRGPALRNNQGRRFGVYKKSLSWELKENWGKKNVLRERTRQAPAFGGPRGSHLRAAAGGVVGKKQPVETGTKQGYLNRNQAQKVWGSEKKALKDAEEKGTHPVAGQEHWVSGKILRKRKS